ncbi:MAG: histidinol-phosphate transaminase [Allomuricauda sp.]|nr:MAG: histidinol-phosphate transaminase [Allomuricauda sp.]
MKKFNLQNLVRENVKSLHPYASARDEFKEFNADMVFLDANENPFENGINRYPDPQQLSLKEILAKQKGVEASEILLGNGSDEVLDLIFRAFCEPNKDNIVTLPPTYGMYKVLAATNAIENREILLSNNFQPQVEQVIQNVDGQTKLIFLCSPNNPTANLFDQDKIVSLLSNFEGLVVIDEAYIDFAETRSWVDRLEEFPNLIVTQTLSKAYGMAGIRLGICYASEAIIGVLNKIKPPYNVNALTQQQAIERVVDTETLHREINEILESRQNLELQLKQIDFVKRIYPSDANFILVEVDDANRRYEELIQKGIVVRNRSSQPLCQNTLRFTIGTLEENKKVVKALNELM